MTAALVLALVAVALPAQQQQPRTLEPTPLEAAVGQTGARLTWTKFAGRLDGRVASAIVTAIAVETPGADPKIMRGVRIELRHEGKRPNCNLSHVKWAILCSRDDAALYIEESRLPEVRAALLRGSAEIHRGHPAGITTFYSSSNGGGILVGGYSLYDRQLAELMTMLDTAADLLRDAPR